VRSLSVVIIAKNEELYIAGCLRSVLAAVAEIGGAQVVVVDSASTDRTVELARSFGVSVVSLRPEWKLSPSAGRYIGFHYTSGDLIMFVDADTRIERDWFRKAVHWFDRQDVAGVSGYLDDSDEQGCPLPYVGKRSPDVRVRRELRGSGLYRRAAMEQAGAFNPHLVAEEEAELGLRLRHAGWTLLQLPHPMGCHERGATASGEILKSLRLGRVRGVGRTWRYACREGSGLRFCFERLRPTMIFALTCLSLSPGLFLWLSGCTKAASLFLAPLTVWLIAVAAKKRSLSGPIIYAATHTLTLYGLLAGALTTQLKDPDDYPRDVVAAADQPVAGARKTLAVSRS
jgi:glycosyltransferase involved in cell wall biosynthesis